MRGVCEPTLPVPSLSPPHAWMTSRARWKRPIPRSTLRLQTDEQLGTEFGALRISVAVCCCSTILPTSAPRWSGSAVGSGEALRAYYSSSISTCSARGFECGRSAWHSRCACQRHPNGSCVRCFNRNVRSALCQSSQKRSDSSCTPRKVVPDGSSCARHS